MVFVGVSNNDTVDDGKDYQQEFGVPYALAHAPEVWDIFKQPFRPTTIVFGPTGTVEHRVDGPITYESLNQTLSRLTS